MTVLDIAGPLPRSTVKVKKLQHDSRRLEVIPRDPERGQYLVESASHPGQLYEVGLELGAMRGTCTCAWAQHGGVNCKHVLAALSTHYAHEGHLSFWRSLPDARRQHRHLVSGEGIYATVRPRRAS